MLPFDNACRCGSSLDYAACCEPYHADMQLPPTALALMRSRFAAFALQNTEYLLHTWDASTRPAVLNLADDPCVWQTLAIVKTHQGHVGDVSGQVEFKAYCAVEDKQYVLHELSRFVKRQGRWFYVDGVIKANGLLSTNATPSKNAPCACGSGKKYKRCCGAA
jgi:SEC-C motif domain protein